MLTWTLALALAADPIQEAWHDLARDRIPEAIAASSALLEADPGQLEVHRLYLHANRGDWQAREQLVRTYRAWSEQNPDDPVPRFALAQAIRNARGNDGCAEAMPLLEPLPEDPVNRYAALRIAKSWADCPGADAVAIEGALVDLPPEAGPAAESYAHLVRAQAGGWDALLAALPDIQERYPQRLGQIAQVAFATELEHPAPEAVRDALLAWAKGYQEGDRIARYNKAAVLRIAGHPKAKAAEKAVNADDPPGDIGLVEPSKLMEKVLAANKVPTHDQAIAGLNELGPRIPEGSVERGLWRYLLRQRLEATEDTDGLFALEAEEARLSPNDPDTVNAWAYECALRGVDLDAALAATTHVMPLLDDDRFTGGSLEEWTDDKRGSRAALLDTHGWLLHLLGREEEAAAALVEANQYLADPTLAGHTAVVLRALKQDEAAWPYLVAAAAPGGTGEPDLDQAVHDSLVALWPDHRVWHPGGLDGWVADQHWKREADAAPEAVSLTESHALLGQPFPFETAEKLGGGTLDLSHDGLMVVDLWATWCGPCVQGMPHLQEVAAAYADRGVRVVGLSVDKELTPVTRFFKQVDPDQIAYDLGFVGADGMKTARVSGIPSLFVLDADGTIAAYISGYGPGDTRLERALDAILAGEPGAGAEKDG